MKSSSSHQQNQQPIQVLIVGVKDAYHYANLAGNLGRLSREAAGQRPIQATVNYGNLNASQFDMIVCVVDGKAAESKRETGQEQIEKLNLKSLSLGDKKPDILIASDFNEDNRTSILKMLDDNGRALGVSYIGFYGDSGEKHSAIVDIIYQAWLDKYPKEVSQISVKCLLTAAREKLLASQVLVNFTEHRRQLLEGFNQLINETVNIQASQLSTEEARATAEGAYKLVRIVSDCLAEYNRLALTKDVDKAEYSRLSKKLQRAAQQFQRDALLNKEERATRRQSLGTIISAVLGIAAGIAFGPLAMAVGGVTFGAIGFFVSHRLTRNTQLNRVSIKEVSVATDMLASQIAHR